MPIPDDLYSVKFADFTESIKILYLTDEGFKSLCNDYCNSKNKTLKYTRKIEKYFKRKIKFENLSRELEEEILIYLIRKA